MIYRKARLGFLLFAILVFGTVTQIFAAAGDLDWLFGLDGIVSTDSGFEGEGVVDLVIQPDGKIIAVGWSHASSNPAYRILFIRYNPNGSLDPTFGIGGRVSISSRNPGAMALQPDGKIVFVSPTGTSPFRNFYVGRLNSDGSADTTFNGTGTVNLNLRGTDDYAHTVKIQPDGKIVVGGTSSIALGNSQSEYAMVRFNANGSLDTTFDGDGKVFTTPAPGQPSGFNELVIQPDGKIVVVGELLTYMGGNLDFEDILILRYNSNGSLDTTFDGDGIVTTRFTPEPPATRAWAYGNSVVVQPDGKLVVVGGGFIPSPTELTMAAIARYNPDGSLDSSFTNGGKILLSFPPYIHSNAFDVALQTDNKIVIAGDAENTFNERNPTVARLNTDGSLDSSFSSDGASVVTGTPNRHSPLFAVAIQSNGKILGGGYNGWNPGSDFMLMRFESSTCTVNCPAAPREKIADFDGDGKTDLSVWRDGNWFINRSSENDPNNYYNQEFGLAAPDYLTPADFDGDQKTDLSVWRTSLVNSPAFLILRSSTNTIRTVLFGITGDDPRVVGDWDGDGRADPAVYRSGASAGAQSYFFYIPSSAPENPVTIPWGLAGDEYVRGDFDGDGRKDAAVYRPSNQTWYVLQSSNSQPLFKYWGLATDKRVDGDFDGDGKTDFTAYRDGVWYVLQSSDNQARYAGWGTNGDRVVAGDYDGDGKTDFAIWRAGVYYILHNSNSQAAYYHFGIPADIPVASAFVR